MSPSRPQVRLQDRGIVQVSGADAARLLDGLVTNDLDQLAAGPAIHTALLNPQGKILFAFFVVKSGADLLLDVARDQAAGLVKRLTMYKLRAAVTLADLSSDMTVVASLAADAPQPPRGILAFADPRDARLGHRMILPSARLPELGEATDDRTAYDGRRVACGVPEEGRDYPLGDTYPHEADFDLQAGVSFTKGCYVGQEVVSRMQNKTVVRKRVVRIAGAGLATGGEIKHRDGVIGTVGSVAGHDALAMIRLDRAAEAAAKGETLTCDGASVTVDATALERYRDSVANKPVIDL